MQKEPLQTAALKSETEQKSIIEATYERMVFYNKKVKKLLQVVLVFFTKKSKMPTAYNCFFFVVPQTTSKKGKEG